METETPNETYEEYEEVDEYESDFDFGFEPLRIDFVGQLQDLFGY